MWVVERRFNMTEEQTGAASFASRREELPPAAQRALAEAEARRKVAAPQAFAAERGGPAGAEPTRYGDWERNGRAVDF